MKISKFLVVGLIALAFVITPFTVKADQISDLQAQIARLMEQIRLLQGQTGGGGTAWCHTFNQNLGVGKNDDEVSYLNGALMRSGLIVAGERNGDRRNENVYDEVTAADVSRFQEKYRADILTPNGLSAPTGYFGPATRAKMNSLYGCNNKVPIPPYPTPAAGLFIADVNGIASVYSPGDTIKLKIKGIELGDGSPASSGEGFNVQVYIYDSARTHTFAGVNGQFNQSSSLWEAILTVPTDPGITYDLDVILYCGGSQCGAMSGGSNQQVNKVFKFKVGTFTGNRPPVINGVSGPTSLKVGETGTWTVQASDPENGTLNYSVIWGDEGTMASGSMMSPPSVPVQQTATFTHTYSRSGTFYPTFIVTDNGGQYGKTSISVNVGNGNGCENGSTYNYLTGALCGTPALQVVSPNGGESWLKGTTQRIGWNWKTDTFVGQPFTIYLTPKEWSPTNPQLIIASGITGTSYYDWNVGSVTNLVTPNQNMAPSQSYYVAVCANSKIDGKQICDQSDSYFKIYDSSSPAPSTLTILSPNGSEIFEKGKTYTIAWGATGAPEVSVYLVRDSDPTYRLAIKHNHMSGRANVIYWTVPGGQTAASDIAIGSDYRIWVIGGGTTAVEDKSDQPFSITTAIAPPQPPLPIDIISSNPPNGAIDARQDRSTTASVSTSGWRSIEHKFSGSVAGIKPSDFAVTTSGGGVPVVTGTPFKVTTAGAVMDTLSVDLDRPIPVNQRTRITYKPSNSSICLGYLPGDVNQNGTVAPADLLDMVDVLNGVKTVPLYAGDIDGNGVITSADHLAFIDILNTSNGKTLPACP